MTNNQSVPVNADKAGSDYDTRYFVANFNDLPYQKTYYTATDVILPLYVLITVLGITSNIMNILVFVKMGLKDTVTISLLALSISDLAFLLVISPFAATLFVDYIVVYRMGITVRWPFDQRILSNPFYWYASMFYETSTLIIVYIAVVRSACVAMPLKVKTVFTVKRTIISFLIILTCCFLLRLPTFLIHSFISVFDPSTNTTQPKYEQLDDGGVANSVNDIYNRNILPWFSFIIVLASVIVMVVKLQESAKFRSSASSKDAGIVSTKDGAPEHAQKVEHSGQRLSAKEVQIVRSVILVASVFIACQLPFVINSLVRRFDPRFNIVNGVAALYPRHFYLYAVSSSISQLCAYTNASVNILVYLFANTRYRECFKSLWVRKS